MEAISSTYLDPKLSPADNLALVLKGQFEVTPLPKIDDDWEGIYWLLSKGLIGLSFGLGSVSLAVIRSGVFIRHYSTVGVIPAFFASFIGYRLAEGRLKEEKRKNYDLKIELVDQHIKATGKVYEGIVDHLKERRQNAELKVMEVFNNKEITEQIGWLHIEEAFREVPEAMELIDLRKALRGAFKARYGKRFIPDFHGLTPLIAQWKTELDLSPNSWRSSNIDLLSGAHLVQNESHHWTIQRQ
ncbi:MAG: hypothetical protein AB7F31_01690 [Parachlamydiales bacterium]